MDNVDYGNHQQALAWLAEHYGGPVNVATGYVGLEGLDALAQIAAEEQPTRLLIGAVPEALAGPTGETVADRFEQSVSALRRERDFSAFPACPASRLRAGDPLLRVRRRCGEAVRSVLPPRQSLHYR